MHVAVHVQVGELAVGNSHESIQSLTTFQPYVFQVCFQRSVINLKSTHFAISLFIVSAHYSGPYTQPRSAPNDPQAYYKPYQPTGTCQLTPYLTLPYLISYCNIPSISFIFFLGLPISTFQPPYANYDSNFFMSDILFSIAILL